VGIVKELMEIWLNEVCDILYRAAMSNLTSKQQAKLKSPIKDVYEYLNSINNCFNSLHSLFSPSLRVVNYFPSRISFYSPFSSSDEDLYIHLQNLNQIFQSSQISSHSAAIIADRGVKKSHIATTVTHIWSNNFIVKQV